MEQAIAGGNNRTATAAHGLILASSSPRRKELLAALGLTFTIDPSDADESFAPGTPPDEVVRMLALRKAESVAARHEQGLVIGSDTIVVLDGAILGKPVDEADARRMLAMLQGRGHAVYSGVAIVDAATMREARQSTSEEAELGDIGRYRVLTETPDGGPQAVIGHSVSKVTFRPMSDGDIEAYVKTGEPLDKAGSYGVQGLGSVFVEKIEGDFYTIMGLPLNLLYQMLLKFGISPFKA